MRPRPQCDTVKWQESVAGEPLVRGIYHLKPSDPLSLWDRERFRKSGREAEVEEERESYQREGERRGLVGMLMSPQLYCYLGNKGKAG